MTNPPPPGNWGTPQPGPQQPYGQGQPPYGPPGQWPQQPGWGPPPPPPKNNSLKWLLIGVAVLLVIAITVGATLLFTRDGGGDPPTATGNTPAAGDIASANDTGPVSIITEDPTCEPWRPIISTLAKQERQGWEARPYDVPASAWTPDQRRMFEAVADAMRQAADQTVALAKLTPHRVMRELYEQSIAYWRAYADSIPRYIERDNFLAGVATDTSGALVAICDAIAQGSAGSRGPLVETSEARQNSSSLGTPDSPQPFMEASGNPVCAEWKRISDNFDRDGEPWRDADPNIPASEWDAQRRTIMYDVVPVMKALAKDLSVLGTKSDNPVLADFSDLAAQYWLAFAAAIPSYTAADSHLSAVAAYSTYAVFNACAAAIGG